MMQPEYKYATKVRLSPVRAIRSYCLNACAGSAKEVRLCTVTECPLFEFRFGKNSARSGIGGGPRDQKGRFFSTETLTNGPGLILAPKKGLDKCEAVPTRPASFKRDFDASQIEESEGKIRIKRTTAGLVISLTQAPQQ